MEEVKEALNIQQRIKRAAIAHRNAPKLERARERAARKLAPENNIKKRAYALARKILRKRVAGGRGAVYQELGPTEKISIDKQLDNKKALIKKIALRLIPKIRQSEQHRLQSFLKGKAMKNDAINEAFEKKFKKKKKKADGYIQFFNKFTEEKQNNTAAYKSLLKKSEKYDVDVDTIGQIYSEAFDEYENVQTTLTADQYAFSRVNKALNELSREKITQYLTKDLRKRNLEGGKKRDYDQYFAKAKSVRLASAKAGYKSSVEPKIAGTGKTSSKTKQEYMAAKSAVRKKLKEENLQELSPETYRSYINASYKARNKEFLDTANRAYTKKREKGIQRADRLLVKKTNEEVENLDELSMRTLGSYNEKARSQLKSHANASAERLANKVRDPKAAADGAKITRKRYEGLNRLARKVNEMKETPYSQQELGKHVKTYRNVRGSKFDLYKNLNGHKLVNRISGASEDFDGHHDTRALHKKLLKTMLPEETGE